MPNKPNYQRALDEIIHTLEQKTASNSSGQDEAKTRAKAPRLLLHSCCAPCSSYVLEYLSDYFAITDFFYNPNIAPQEEYRYREEELKRLIREMHPKYEIAFVAGNMIRSGFMRLCGAWSISGRAGSGALPATVCAWKKRLCSPQRVDMIILQRR